MRSRLLDAYYIHCVGVCNPKAVARALVKAIDSACEESRREVKEGAYKDFMSNGAKNDPACMLIADQLCRLLGMPSPSDEMDEEEWKKMVDMAEEAYETGRRKEIKACASS